MASSLNFFIKIFWKLFLFFCDRRESKLWRLFEYGEQRIDQEFNIAKLVKAARNLKIFMQDYLKDYEAKFKIKNRK